MSTLRGTFIAILGMLSGPVFAAPGESPKYYAAPPLQSKVIEVPLKTKIEGLEPLAYANKAYQEFLNQTGRQCYRLRENVAALCRQRGPSAELEALRGEMSVFVPKCVNALEASTNTSKTDGMYANRRNADGRMKKHNQALGGASAAGSDLSGFRASLSTADNEGRLAVAHATKCYAMAVAWNDVSAAVSDDLNVLLACSGDTAAIAQPALARLRAKSRSVEKLGDGCADFAVKTDAMLLKERKDVAQQSEAFAQQGKSDNRPSDDKTNQLQAQTPSYDYGLANEPASRSGTQDSTPVAPVAEVDHLKSTESVEGLSATPEEMKNVQPLEGEYQSPTPPPSYPAGYPYDPRYYQPAATPQSQPQPSAGGGGQPQGAAAPQQAAKPENKMSDALSRQKEAELNKLSAATGTTCKTVINKTTKKADVICSQAPKNSSSGSVATQAQSSVRALLGDPKPKK